MGLTVTVGIIVVIVICICKRIQNQNGKRSIIRVDWKVILARNNGMDIHLSCNAQRAHAPKLLSSGLCLFKCLCFRFELVYFSEQCQYSLQNTLDNHVILVNYKIDVQIRLKKGLRLYDST